jgi:hypothetical protein
MKKRAFACTGAKGSAKPKLLRAKEAQKRRLFGANEAEFGVLVAAGSATIPKDNDQGDRIRRPTVAH